MGTGPVASSTISQGQDARVLMNNYTANNAARQALENAQNPNDTEQALDIPPSRRSSSRLSGGLHRSFYGETGRRSTRLRFQPGFRSRLWAISLGSSPEHSADSRFQCTAQ